ncbi:hypothetical protein THAOC_14545 [Thalassiosira oceanica]|uniref:Peptide deformylase n=1 Tax=Thalassiosira oceanica TaxID=159749 RepID=K0SHD2_THAOC|nr:hypothetical protein THAOC_14545 [Thalassiosira oceanica]|eukprot:EJK64700.1 hypothetical protein THAOC_14545 [Thalassiosira oceanica]
MKTRTLVAMAGVTCVDSFNPGNPPRSNKRPAAAAADREVMLSSISPRYTARFGDNRSSKRSNEQEDFQDDVQKKVEADEEKKPSPITSITDPRLKNLATPIEGWQGTGLPNKSLSDAYQELVTYKDFISKDTQCEQLVLPLARWPDPILRKATKKVPLSIFEDRSKLDELKLLAKALRNTARRQNSAGLAARQCGIDASILFIERVEPSVQRRTSEGRATIVTIEFEQLLSSLKSGDNKIDGKTAQMTLAGELGRRILHEMDHDRGVLIADYVESLDEMLSVDGNPFMMLIENCDGKHAQRRERAYSRPLEKATILT